MKKSTYNFQIHKTLGFICICSSMILVSCPNPTDHSTIVENIIITAPNALNGYYGEVQLTANITYSSGSNADIYWEITSGSIATINSITGLVSPTSPGTISVTASAGGIVSSPISLTFNDINLVGTWVGVQSSGPSVIIGTYTIIFNSNGNYTATTTATSPSVAGATGVWTTDDLNNLSISPGCFIFGGDTVTEGTYAINEEVLSISTFARTYTKTQ